MAIDPSIPLGVKAPEPINPMDIVGKMQQLRAQQQTQEANALEIQQRRGQMAQQQEQFDSQKAIDTAMQQAMTTGPDGRPTFNRQALQTQIVTKGYGHAWPAIQKTLDDADKAALEFQTNQTKAAEAQRDYFASLASGVKEMNYDPGAFVTAVSAAVAHQAITKEQAQGYIDKIQQDPTAIKGFVDGILAQSPKQVELANAQAGHVETNRHNLAMEGNTGTDNARQQAAQAEAARHNRAMEARPVAGQVRPDIPGNWDVQGADFLQSIPAQWRKTVEKIAHYDEDPTKVASMRGGMREALMQWVNQVNPGYDQSQFANRSPTRKAFTTGTQGKQITNINTALGHIDQLTTVADELQNGGFVPGNKAFNTVRTMFGEAQVTNFDTLKDALAGEVAGVLSQSGATVSGISDAQNKIKSASSPKQLAGYVKTLIPVMGSKLAALDYQFHQAMGEADTFSALSSESKRILEKHGFDPAHPTIGATTAPVTVGGFSVKVKNH